MKKLIALFMATSLILAGCTQATVETETEEIPSTSEEVQIEETPEEISRGEYNIATLSGPTGIGFAKMNANEEQSSYNIEVFGAPDEVVAKIVKGEVDIASVPANLASTLYTKTESGVSVLAINTLGVLYVVETGEEINTIADLEGKTVYSTGKGATPEYGFNYILDKAGIKDSVTVEFKTEHAELAALLSSGEADLAVLPEPFVTTALSQNENLRVALDLTAEWDALDDTSDMITGVLIARNEVIDENPELINQFLEDYKASIEATENDLENVAKLSVEMGIIPSEAVAMTAIPNANIVYIDGEEMETALSGYLDVLFNQNPASIGGNLPNEDFYYSK